MFCDSKGMLNDRIVALRNANVFAPHFYRHLVSNTRVISESDGEIKAETNYAVFQTLLDGQTQIFNVGKYEDTMIRQDGKLLFKEKLCIFDTYRIQTLMVTPI